MISLSANAGPSPSPFTGDQQKRFDAGFEKAVAKGRKISQSAVHDTYGQGLSFGADKAKKLGMVDSVGTLDDVLARFGVTMASPSTSMEDETPEIAAIAESTTVDDGAARSFAARKRQLEIAAA